MVQLEKMNTHMLLIIAVVQEDRAGDSERYWECIKSVKRDTLTFFEGISKLICFFSRRVKLLKIFVFLVTETIT